MKKLENILIAKMFVTIKNFGDSEKIMIAEDDKIIRTDKETVKVLNEFVSNVNLNIPQFSQIDWTSENISDPVIKTIMKYRAHASIIAIK